MFILYCNQSTLKVMCPTFCRVNCFRKIKIDNSSKNFESYFYDEKEQNLIENDEIPELPESFDTENDYANKSDETLIIKDSNHTNTEINDENKSDDIFSDELHNSTENIDKSSSNVITFNSTHATLFNSTGNISLATKNTTKKIFPSNFNLN